MDVWRDRAKLAAFTDEDYVVRPLDRRIVPQQVSESLRVLSCDLYLFPKVGSQYL